jgi:hypothetical protein
MNTPIPAQWAGLLLAATVAPALPAAESYKWRGADGSVHYGQVKPDDGSGTEKVLVYDEQEELTRARRQLELERLRLERDQAMLETERNSRPAPTAAPRPQTVAGADLNYDDRQKLHQIERDIERLSTSSIGTVQDRQMQINALTRQRDAVYGSYGVQPGTMVTIQDNRAAPVPGVDFYPIPPQPVLPPAGSPNR